MRHPLRAGRLFDARDRAGSPRVVIVNERLAHWAWPGQPAIGRPDLRAAIDRPCAVSGSSATMRLNGVQNTTAPSTRLSVRDSRAPMKIL